jgi:hypothetical protein
MRFSHLFLLSLLIVLFYPQSTSGFGVDVCFNDPAAVSGSGRGGRGQSVIRNCIGVERSCRMEPLRGAVRENLCKVQALGDSLSGLSGNNAIIGGRSLVHSDSTYVIAQFVGFSAWEAYQIMIYDEATDQSDYVPFAQDGQQMLTNTEIEDCYSSNFSVQRACLAITPKMTGIYKFNSETGGQLLHFHARFSDDQIPPGDIEFPADYFSPEFVGNERLLDNLRGWAFGARKNACAAGVVKDPGDPESPCVASSAVLNSPINFFSAGFAKLAINFRTTLGELIIHDGADPPRSFE